MTLLHLDIIQRALQIWLCLEFKPSLLDTPEAMIILLHATSWQCSLGREEILTDQGFPVSTGKLGSASDYFKSFQVLHRKSSHTTSPGIAGAVYSL